MLKLQFKDQRADPVWVVDKSFSIGCDDDNQLVINDSSVSRQHARISFSDGNYTLRDLGSSEGVFVNNRRINKKPINSGDKIRIGNIDLLVSDPIVDGKQENWSFVACSSWLTGQEFAIPARAKNSPIKVGRSSHCDIIFPGTHLSREHIELKINGDCIEVKDLGSANGTFINDQRISEGKLYPGDSIRLDVYSFTLLGPGASTTKREIEPKPSIAQQLNLIPSHRTDSLGLGLGDNTNEMWLWKTRPTSPGNRNEGMSASRESIGQMIIAGALGGAVLGLGLYLLLC